MPARRAPLLAAALAVAAAVILAAVPAGARASTWTTTSSNWAGYAASAPGVRFSRVSATWTAPQAHCASGRRRYSAVWVGLGGLHSTAEALEQVGTEADCAGGKGYYSAWYELVPDVPVKVDLAVRPGDTMSAAVTVEGHSVTLFIANRTRGTSFTRRLTAAQVDVSSAEWIVEAPSACGDNGGCRALPLADFGTTPSPTPAPPASPATRGRSPTRRGRRSRSRSPRAAAPGRCASPRTRAPAAPPRPTSRRPATRSR